MSGAVIPELVIQAALVAGMQHLREDPARFGQLFRDMSKPQRDAITKWFTNEDNRVRTVFGYPRQDASFPVWSVRVLGDTESQAFLGDYVDNNVLPLHPPPQWGNEDEYETEPQFLGDGVTYQTETTYQEERPLGTEDDPEDELREVGDGGDPYAERDTLIEHSGAFYRADVEIQTLTDVPGLVLVLSHVARAILHRARIFLERNGLMNVVIGRREYAPIAGYFPVVAYAQSVTLRFEYLFAEPQVGPSIDELTVVLQSLNFPGDTPLSL